MRARSIPAPIYVNPKPISDQNALPPRSSSLYYGHYDEELTVRAAFFDQTPAVSCEWNENFFSLHSFIFLPQAECREKKAIAIGPSGTSTCTFRPKKHGKILTSRSADIE